MKAVATYSRYTKVCSFKGDPELWSEFKSECKLRGTSICAVEDALIRAWLEGQKATATVIKPVTVNLTTQYVVERPRRKHEPELCVPNYYKCERKIFKLLDAQFKGGDKP